jgi:hypothetical protein
MKIEPFDAAFVKMSFINFATYIVNLSLIKVVEMFRSLVLPNRHKAISDISNCVLIRVQKFYMIVCSEKSSGP